MAMYGEWVMKGAVLSEKTALKEYGVSRDFLVEGIRAGKLEYRQGVMWGNPYLRILRRQLETYLAERKGTEQTESLKVKDELRKVTSEIRRAKAKLTKLQARKKELEATLAEAPTAA